MLLKLSILLVLTAFSTQAQVYVIVDETKANQIFQSNYQNIIEHQSPLKLQFALKNNKYSPSITEISFFGYNKHSSRVILERTNVITFLFKELKGVLSLSLPGKEASLSAMFDISAVKCSYSGNKHLNKIIYNWPEFNLKLSSLISTEKDYQMKHLIEKTLKTEIQTVKKAIFAGIRNSIEKNIKYLPKTPEVQYNSDVRYKIVSYPSFNVNELGISLRISLLNNGERIDTFQKSSIRISRTESNTVYLEQSMLSEYLFFLAAKGKLTADSRKVEVNKFVQFDILETIFPSISDSFTAENEINAKFEVIQPENHFLSGIFLEKSKLSLNIPTKVTFFVDSQVIYSFEVRIKAQTEAKIEGSMLKIKNLKLKAEKVKVLSKFSSEEDSELIDSVRLLIKTAQPFIFGSINNLKVFADIDVDAEITESHVEAKLN